MKPAFIAVLVLLAAADVSAAPPKLTGSWEGARNTDDERVSLVLKDMGKAEIINEYDISLPGQGKRRGRSTSFGTWTLKGDEVVVTYSKIRDRLRYGERVSLKAVGRDGDASALQPVGKPDPHSKIGTAVLWKAPHEYRMKTTAPAVPDAASPPTSESVGSPSK